MVSESCSGCSEEIWKDIQFAVMLFYLQESLLLLLYRICKN